MTKEEEIMLLDAKRSLIEKENKMLHSLLSELTSDGFDYELYIGTSRKDKLIDGYNLFPLSGYVALEPLLESIKEIVQDNIEVSDSQLKELSQ